jgi:aspartate 1-decarboxylase
MSLPTAVLAAHPLKRFLGVKFPHGARRKVPFATPWRYSDSSKAAMAAGRVSVGQIVKLVEHRGKSRNTCHQFQPPLHRRLNKEAIRMHITLMKGKIHRARVTEADLHYEGSISIDRSLIEAAGFLVNERVDIYNIDTGARFSTYVIEAPRDSGKIGLNGAAARLALTGDKLIIVSYASFDLAEARSFEPRVVLVNEQNQILAGDRSENNGTSVRSRPPVEIRVDKPSNTVQTRED